MATAPAFLTAEWRKLILANYAVDAALLRPYLPAGTQLDRWNGRCYLSLVGFMFVDTRLKGMPVPCHSNFEEVNLRFYVTREMPDGSVRRGVTFIKELVPKPAISFVANTIYKEHYETLPMRHWWKNGNGQLEVCYEWRKGRWHSFRVIAGTDLLPIENGGEAEFITEHYWGYTKLDARRTSEYPVEHPRWEVYPVQKYTIDVDFGRVYGKDFAFLAGETPVSVMLAEGSEIVVRKGRRL